MINLPTVQAFSSQLVEINTRKRQAFEALLKELKTEPDQWDKAKILDLSLAYNGPWDYSISAADFEQLLPFTRSPNQEIRELVGRKLSNIMRSLSTEQIESLYRICPDYKSGLAYRLYQDHPETFVYLPIYFYLSGQAQRFYLWNQQQIDVLALYRNDPCDQMRYFVWASIGRYLIHTYPQESISRLSDAHLKISQSVQLQILEQVERVEALDTETVFSAMVNRIQDLAQILSNEREQEMFSQLDGFYQSHQDRLNTHPSPEVQDPLKKYQHLANAILETGTHILESQRHFPEYYFGLIPTTYRQAEQALADLRASQYPQVSTSRLTHLKQWPESYRPLLRQLVSAEFPLDPLEKWLELLPDLNILETIDHEWLTHPLAQTRIAAIKTYKAFQLKIPSQYIHLALTDLNPKIQDQIVDYLANTTYLSDSALVANEPHRNSGIMSEPNFENVHSLIKAGLLTLMHRDQEPHYNWNKALTNAGIQANELLANWYAGTDLQNLSARHTRWFVEFLIRYESGFGQQHPRELSLTPEDWQKWLALDAVKQALLYCVEIWGDQFNETLKQALHDSFVNPGWGHWLQASEAVYPYFYAVLKLHKITSLLNNNDLTASLWQQVNISRLLDLDSIEELTCLLDAWAQYPDVFEPSHVMDLFRACIHPDLRTESKSYQRLLQQDDPQDYERVCSGLQNNTSTDYYGEILYLERNQARDATAFLLAQQSKLQPFLRYATLHLLLQWGAIQPAQSEAEQFALKQKFPVLFWEMLGIEQNYTQILPSANTVFFVHADQETSNTNTFFQLMGLIWVF